MRRSSRALVLALGASLAAVSPATARVPAAGTNVDLKMRADVRITGEPADGLGTAVAAAGDVNGDGIADVLAGAPGGDRVYVVLGSPTATTFDAAKRGTRGWVITGTGIGGEVAGVGDVNADGLDDVAVSAPGRSTAWVVFGSRSRKTVSTAKLGARGFRIAGTANAAAGTALAGVADLDRDGRADLAVAEPGTRTVWIVRGSESSAAVRLAAGARTRAISGLPAGTLRVAGVADVNGRGRGDVLIGTPQADGNRGGAVLVFGESARNGVDVASSAFTGGFRLGSAGAGTFTGAGVGGWGDTTGDKVPDLVVGAPGALAEPTAASASGSLVYGARSDAPNLTASRRIGPTAPTGDRLGTSAHGAGDLNGDGLADVVLGAPSAGRNGRGASGTAIVVYGAAAGAPPVTGSAPGAAGFLVDGDETGARAGTSVTGAGDVNGDGGADLLIGSPGAGGATKNGQAAVLFGSVRGAAGGAPVPSAPPSPPIGQANRSPDSSIRSPRLARQSGARLRTIRGVASDDKELARVEVSLVRSTGAGAKRRCSALRPSGAFRRYAARAGKCRPAGFLKAKGTTEWSLALRSRLAPGAYLLTSRAVDAQGLKELASSAKDHTRVVFRVR